MARKKQDWSTRRLYHVWVLIWTTEWDKGSDASVAISVFSSLQNAHHGAADIITANIESDPHQIDDREDLEEIVKRIDAGLYEDAMDLYQEVIENEKFEIVERDIDDLSEPS